MYPAFEIVPSFSYVVLQLFQNTCHDTCPVFRHLLKYKDMGLLSILYWKRWLLSFILNWPTCFNGVPRERVSLIHLPLPEI
jgi:hypothetical protein